MNKSAEISDLAAALAKAQGEIKAAVKDTENPFFHSKYADLASVWSACRDALSKHGLAVIQLPGPTSDAGATLTTILTHASGQWIEETCTAPLMKKDPQGVGSALTYLRRYALAAVVGVVADEDDDANAASTPPPAKRQRAEKPSSDVPQRFVVEGSVTGGEQHAKGEKKWWSIHLVDTETGEETIATTFSSTDAKAASDAKAAGLPVVATLERKGNFTNLVEIQS